MNSFAKKNTSATTEACCHFAPPTEACCHFAPPTEACCHFAPPIGLKSTNRIQREFDSNGAIPPFDAFLASSHPRQKTNLFKQFRLRPLPAKRSGGLLPLRARQTEFKENFRAMSP
jgi:hypothetical protein